MGTVKERPHERTQQVLCSLSKDPVNSFQGTFLCVIIDSPPGVFQIANVLSLGYKNLGKDPTGSLHLK